MISPVVATPTILATPTTSENSVMDMSPVACCVVLSISLAFFPGYVMCDCSNRVTCSEDNPVVHVIPHSHCDAGYRNTFEFYYEMDVQDIIDSVLQALLQDQSKRFVWEEVSYLSRWWQDASEDQKAQMKKLVASGQLEFIGGGWVMHDEADTSVYAILNQLSIGLDFLERNLGVRPKVEWHIDPFGHSIFMPELYSLLDYKAVIINRIPDHIKQQMKVNKGLEFHWKSPYSNRTIFTHVLDSHYSTPLIIGLNTEERANFFVNDTKERLKWYKTQHLLIPFGGDFAFHDATESFKDMDEIIAYVNVHSEDYGLTARYSTLSEYIEAVTTSGIEFETRSGDFFPYIACYPCGSPPCDGPGGVRVPCGPESSSDSYWSGFYTSKPSQKLLVRKQEASLKVLEVLNSYFPQLYPNISDVVQLSRNTSALLQHHDAITGTSYLACYVDYNMRLQRAMDLASNSTGDLKSAVLCGLNNIQSLTSDSVSVLSALSAQNVAVVAIYNPMEFERSTYAAVTLPEDLCVEVMSGGGVVVPSQQVGTRLYFPVQLAPRGVQVLFMKATQCSHSRERKALAGFALSNGVLELNFNGRNKLVGWGKGNETHSVQHSYVQYVEKAGTLFHLNPCDGTNVYTFVPDVGRNTLTPEFIPTMLVANGPLVWEAEQQINSYINATIRLFKPLTSKPTVAEQFATFVEWQTKIGPLPVHPPTSVGSLFATDIGTDQFTTYTSGFYPLERQYNYSVPLQGNTYPMVGRAFVGNKRTNNVFAVVSQRPMGMTAYNGTLEFTLHRRIVISPLDLRGDDNSIMQDSVLVGFLPQGSAPVVTSQAMSAFQSPLSLHFALVNSTSDWEKSCKTKWSPMNASLPLEVQVLTTKLLRMLSANKVDLGIHLLNIDESLAHTVDLSNLFGGGWSVLSVQETSPDFQVAISTRSSSVHTGSTVLLEPLNLRSFVVTISTSSP